MILRTIFKHYLSSALKYIPFYNSTYPSSNLLRTIFKHYLNSALKYIPFYNSAYPGRIYLFEVNNENIGTTCKICSKLTIKTENISQLALEFLYLILNKEIPAGYYRPALHTVTHRGWEILLKYLTA